MMAQPVDQMASDLSELPVKVLAVDDIMEEYGTLEPSLKVLLFIVQLIHLLKEIMSLELMLNIVILSLLSNILSTGPRLNAKLLPQELYFITKA